jgi:hypothetical protein
LRIVRAGQVSAARLAYGKMGLERQPVVHCGSIRLSMRIHEVISVVVVAASLVVCGDSVAAGEESILLSTCPTGIPANPPIPSEAYMEGFAWAPEGATVLVGLTAPITPVPG